MIPGSTNQLLAAGVGYQISRSVRLRSSASAYFNRTPASATNRQTWTWSAWVKRGQLGTLQQLFTAGTGGSDRTVLYFGTGNLLEFYTVATTQVGLYQTSAVFRDPSAWYHIVCSVDTTNATAANRLILYINGVQQTLTTTTTIAQNSNLYVNSNVAHAIGREAYTAANYVDGYLTEINFIDGQALTPASFGETDIFTGVWKPKKYVGTYGTNGFYLNFSDNSAATAAAIGADRSGNGNNWTPNNISVTAGATYDSMLDVPTPWPDGGNGRGNYCTLNPLDTSQNGSAGTLSNGNLTRTDSTATNTATFGTMFVSSGQWYYEVLVQAISSTTANCFAALSTNNKAVFVALRPDGSVLGCTKSGSGTYTTNDVLGIAVDIAANTVYVYKNGALLYTLTPTTALTDFTPSIADGTSATGAVTASFNFGQQPFSYTPPSGFRALNTLNLPTPTIAKGNQYFDATLYTGTGAARSVTNSGAMQPDLVWVKGRSTAYSHYLADAVRGTGRVLSSDSTGAEIVSATTVTAFNADGFSLGTEVGLNNNTTTYVGWQWKEGATQGFDIVTYTGDGTSNRQISHSLGVTPAMIIVKVRSTTNNWRVWHQRLTGSTYYLGLNQTAAEATSSTVFNGQSSTTFTVGNDPSVNVNAGTFVAYLFSEVAGFSRFGSYTGNGSADGPFVFTGFRPRYVMFKRSDAVDGWIVFDTARNPQNLVTAELFPHNSSAEGDAAVNSRPIDILSNGFKVRGTNSAVNTNGGTYIFAAFSEVGFKYALAR